MALWKKLWLLFTVVWVVVATLNAVTILAFAEEVERGKALTPMLFGVAVPAAVYVLGWLWELWRKRQAGRTRPRG
ncbi:MAG: hypothetical protein A3G81_25855 [Betaproteobacteria bacterium RIFCSPLOWO2_12_FULL_65_14]|nr:MAG: hypothetical protein A3G81_25855 [Betaproteobacteria bacterium RIFCSPLOWO2_12_FULL_65_14]